MKSDFRQPGQSVHHDFGWGINGGGCGGLGCGTAFELTPSGDGKWKERVLPGFTGGVDGGLPSAGFILDSAGNLYSTTSSGGTAAQATGFEIRT
jgi:hypothetical protein